MKMIIPFDIKHRKKIESGEYKVKTAMGHNARIVCWDAMSQFDEPIVALLEYEDREVAVNYTKEGRYIGNNDNYLQIVTDEPEVDPEEEAYMRGYKKGQEDAYLYDKMVDGVVVKDIDNNHFVRTGIVYGLRFGEKVRVIIISDEK